jgi:hypothetical protein
MSTPSVAGGPIAGPRDRGHTLGVWSLLMLPFLVVSGIVGGVAGSLLLAPGDLEGSEPLSQQGAWGVSASVVSTLLFMTPMIVGVVLGLRARRLGERRLGTIGPVVDGAILVLYMGLSTSSWLTQ